MTALTSEQRAAPCEFVPPNEPWSCRTHPGGLRTSLDEEQCDVARPAEPFNDAYLDNIRASLAEGKRLQGHYIIRRLLATLDAQRESALLAIAEPGEAGLTARIGKTEPRPKVDIIGDRAPVADAGLDVERLRVKERPRVFVHPIANLDLATLAYVRESMVGVEAAGGTVNPVGLIDSIVATRAEVRGESPENPDFAPTEPPADKSRWDADDDGDHSAFTHD